MHAFTDLVEGCATLTLEALRQANKRTIEELQMSAATPLVKALQMVQLQKVLLATGMFSLFEAILQNGLNCSDGFTGASNILDREGEAALTERFRDLQLAINVLSTAVAAVIQLSLQKPKRCRSE
jgi:putative copper export protein